jgi:peptide/nickel transport system substrate-binding protein
VRPGPAGRGLPAGSLLVLVLVMAGCARATAAQTGSVSRSGVSAASGSAPTTAGSRPEKPAGNANEQGTPLVTTEGGTVTMAVDSVPTTLNDHTVSGHTPSTQALCSLIWPQVFQVSPGVEPVLDTDVVESAEVVSVDPQTVVYQINPKAEWADGTPITAEDFEYNWVSQEGSGRDMDGTPDSVASVAGYDDISSVTGSNGGRTVTVVFETPFADWESLFDDLLPAHVAEQVGWNDGFDQFGPAAEVSGGPWVISSWVPGQRVVLVRNPRWWGTPPRLDELVLQAEPGASAVAQALRSGVVQVAAPAAFDPAFEADVSSAPTLESQVSLGTTMLQLAFNVRQAPLDNASIRQGIAHVIERAELVSDLVQPIDPLVWEDNDHLFANAQRWYTDDATGYEQADPQTAARDLSSAGLVTDADGTWTWHGVPLTLTFVWASDDPWSAMVGPALAAQLLSAGFDVNAVPVTSAALFGSVLPGAAFGLALVPITAGAYPSALAPAFGAPAGQPAGAVSDWSGFDDPKIDALFAQATQQLAATPDQQLYQQIDVALWNAMPTLPLFAEPEVMVWSASLSGVRADAGGLGLLWSAPDWAQLGPASTKSTASAHRGKRISGGERMASR